LYITRKPVVYLNSGLFAIDPAQPIVLKKGVSLKGNLERPTILSVKNKTLTGTIEGSIYVNKLVYNIHA
jgi:hypothetical protein